jgi:LysM repeat protein
MRETEGLYRAARVIRRVLVGIVMLVVIVIAGGYLFLMRNVDQRDAWTDAARELHGNVLHYGEPIIRTARVYRRRPTSYYRAVNGLLVATPERLLFVGLEPQDKLAGEDAPAAIVTSEIPNDTLVRVTPQRLYALSAPGVVITRGPRREEYAAARGHDAELDSLAAYVERRHAAERRTAQEDRLLHQQVAELEKRRVRYVVQPGDALSTIATRFGVSQADISEWNRLKRDRVRLRDTLIVRNP